MGVTSASCHRLAFTTHEPIGIVAAVSAFNHPLNLIVHQVGPAVAAGCTVVVKPAEDTPLSCLRLIGLLREAGRVHEWVTEAVERGAECLAGGEPLRDSCYPATVLLNPPLDVRINQQEIFGPVVCVYPYDDVADAIQEANSLPFAFQAAVFTKDLDFAMGVASRLAASAVMINDHSAFRVDWMPFAGLRKSGLGVGGIPYTFHDMRQEKLLVLHSTQL